MNLYIGNIPYTLSKDDLNELFSAYGEVSSANIVIDKATNRSKGFGFVEMPNDSEANSAISELNGREMNGRKLTVNEARPRPEGGGQRSSGGGGEYRSRRY